MLQPSIGITCKLSCCQLLKTVNTEGIVCCSLLQNVTNFIAIKLPQILYGTIFFNVYGLVDSFTFYVQYGSHIHM